MTTETPSNAVDLAPLLMYELALHVEEFRMGTESVWVAEYDDDVDHAKSRLHTAYAKLQITLMDVAATKLAPPQTLSGIRKLIAQAWDDFQTAARQDVDGGWEVDPEFQLEYEQHSLSFSPLNQDRWREIEGGLQALGNHLGPGPQASLQIGRFIGHELYACIGTGVRVRDPVQERACRLTLHHALKQQITAAAHFLPDLRTLALDLDDLDTPRLDALRKQIRDVFTPRREGAISPTSPATQPADSSIAPPEQLDPRLGKVLKRLFQLPTGRAVIRILGDDGYFGDTRRKLDDLSLDVNARYEFHESSVRRCVKELQIHNLIDNTHHQNGEPGYYLTCFGTAIYRQINKLPHVRKLTKEQKKIVLSPQGSSDGLK